MIKTLKEKIQARNLKYIERLKKLAAHCVSPEPWTAGPSDASE